MLGMHLYLANQRVESVYRQGLLKIQRQVCESMPSLLALYIQRLKFMLWNFFKYSATVLDLLKCHGLQSDKICFKALFASLTIINFFLPN